MNIIAISGDPGGARSLIPALEVLDKKAEEFAIVDHRFLGNEAAADWKRIPPIMSGETSLENIFSTGRAKVLVFTTSVKDKFPLQAALMAKQFGLKVLCLIDNWMNYTQRLKIDGETIFIPDAYMVMDDLAKAEAISEGLPESILRIVGQPALGTLATEYQNWKKKGRTEYFENFGLDVTKKLIAFISEPASKDQGSGAENPQYRGYTERTILRQLCEEFQPFADDHQLCIVPHPREDAAELDAFWKQYRGEISGGLLKLKSGREAVFLADGVAGMASMLLYEAWLINKPVISLQPGLLRPQLAFMQKRKGAYCVTETQQWHNDMLLWMCQGALKIGQ